MYNVYEPERLRQIYDNISKFFFGQIQLLVFLYDASTSILKNHARKCVNTLQPWKLFSPRAFACLQTCPNPLPPLPSVFFSNIARPPTPVSHYCYYIFFPLWPWSKFTFFAVVEAGGEWKRETSLTHVHARNKGTGREKGRN